MILICQTTSDDSAYQAARVELKREWAKSLLTYRTLWKKADAHDSRLYCLEFFDDSVAFGEDFDDEDVPDDRDNWFVVEGPADLDTPYRVAARTMKVTRTGVLWSASPRHSAGYFETPEISWDDLEAVARGEVPFHSTDDAGPEDVPGDTPL